MAPHAHNGVDNIAYTASMMEKAKLDLSAQFPAKDRSPPSTMLARPLFPVADKIRQKNSTDEVSSPSPWEKLPVIATYADATNLAMRFPQLAFEVLNRPLLSSYNVEKKEPEPEVESTPMTLSPMVAPAPPPVKVPAHTPGKPNWALAPEDEPCLPAAAQFTRGGGYKRGRGTQRANNYRQSRTNPTCFPEFQVKDYEAYTSDPTGVQGLETFEAYAVAPGAARASTVVEPVWSRCDNIHPDSNHAETYTESNSNSNVNITYQPSSIVPSWNNTDVVPNEAPVQDNHYSHQAAAPGLTGPIRDCLSPYMRERFKAILPGVRDLPPHVGREPHLRTRESKSAAAERSIQGEWYTADNGWAGAPVLRQQSAQDHVAPTPAPARAQYAYLPEKDMIMSDPAPQDKWRASNGSWTASPSQQERQPTHQEPVQQKPAAIADRYKCEEDFEKTTGEEEVPQDRGYELANEADWQTVHDPWTVPAVVDLPEKHCPPSLRRAPAPAIAFVPARTPLHPCTRTPIVEDTARETEYIERQASTVSKERKIPDDPWTALTAPAPTPTPALAPAIALPLPNFRVRTRPHSFASAAARAEPVIPAASSKEFVADEWQLQHDPWAAMVVKGAKLEKPPFRSRISSAERTGRQDSWKSSCVSRQSSASPPTQTRASSASESEDDSRSRPAICTEQPERLGAAARRALGYERSASPLARSVVVGQAIQVETNSQQPRKQVSPPPFTFNGPEHLNTLVYHGSPPPPAPKSREAYIDANTRRSSATRVGAMFCEVPLQQPATTVTVTTAPIKSDIQTVITPASPLQPAHTVLRPEKRNFRVQHEPISVTEIQKHAVPVLRAHSIPKRASQSRLSSSSLPFIPEGPHRRKSAGSDSGGSTAVDIPQNERPSNAVPPCHEEVREEVRGDSEISRGYE